MSQLVAPDVLSRRSSLLAALRKERASFLAFSRAQYPSEQQGLERLRKALESVTIIVGSARGGTSVFKDALCQAQGVASLPGEHRLLFTLLELCFPDHGGPDERCTRAFLHGHEREFLVENLLYECRGDPEWTDTAPDRERFGHEWALRFRLQWPELDIPLSWIAARVVDAYARLRARTSREDADDLT